MRTRLPALILVALLSSETTCARRRGGEGERLRKSGRYADARDAAELGALTIRRRSRRGCSSGSSIARPAARPRSARSGIAFTTTTRRATLDKTKARPLMYVAPAARYLGGWHDANDTFRDAVDADPNGNDGARANVAWAALFLEKYDAGHAEQSLEEALKVMPRRRRGACADGAREAWSRTTSAPPSTRAAAALTADPKNCLALDLARRGAGRRRALARRRARRAKGARRSIPRTSRARTLVAAVR